MIKWPVKQSRKVSCFLIQRWTIDNDFVFWTELSMSLCAHTHLTCSMSKCAVEHVKNGQSILDTTLDNRRWKLSGLTSALAAIHQRIPSHSIALFYFNKIQSFYSQFEFGNSAKIFCFVVFDWPDWWLLHWLTDWLTDWRTAVGKVR